MERLTWEPVLLKATIQEIINGSSFWILSGVWATVFEMVLQGVCKGVLESYRIPKERLQADASIKISEGPIWVGLLELWVYW